MNCAEIHLFLHAYVDGELDAMRSLEVEQHAKGCPGCAAKLNSLKSLHSALQEAELAYHAPASLRSKVRQMAGATDEPTGLHVPNLQWLWKWLAVGATAVAIFTLLLRPTAIPTTADDEVLDEVVGSHVRSLMPGHLTDVVSSDQHTVKPWFEGKLDFAPDVKDFTPQEFPLVGGRLDYINGRTVAAMVYRHNKHLINVFIWPSTNANSAGGELSKYQGYSVLTFDADNFHYCIVSDMEETELKQLAGLLEGEK